MVTVGIFEAKTHFSHLLKQAELGEHIVITRHGQPVAKIIPYESVSYQQKMKLLNDELLNMRKGQDKGAKAGNKIKDLIADGRRY